MTELPSTAVAEADIEREKKYINMGANVESRDPVGNVTPLFQSIILGSSDLALTLLEAGANFDTPHENGLTPFTQAVSGELESVVSLMVLKGANVNSRTVDGLTPLMRAGAKGNLKIAKILLDSGASVHAADYNNRKIIWFAELGRNRDLIKLIKLEEITQMKNIKDN